MQGDVEGVSALVSASSVLRTSTADVSGTSSFVSLGGLKWEPEDVAAATYTEQTVATPTWTEQTVSAGTWTELDRQASA